MGSDIEAVIRKRYVVYKRQKQFATLANIDDQILAWLQQAYDEVKS